jgi:hypothetical protein
MCNESMPKLAKQIPVTVALIGKPIPGGGTELFVDCPYCGDIHKHKGTADEIQRRWMTHRISHCESVCLYDVGYLAMARKAPKHEHKVYFPKSVFPAEEE